MARWIIPALLFALAAQGAAAQPAAADRVTRARDVAIGVLAKSKSPINGLTQACLALEGAGRAGDPAAAAAVGRAADAVLARALRGSDNRLVGWGYDGDKNCAGPGTSDAFGDGTCNSADTAYGFQTGMALTCLARAATTAKRPDLGEAARSVISRWMADAMRPCAGCLVFQGSTSANDRGRSVRNMNAAMGMAAAWTYLATSDAQMRQAAQGVAAAEARETAAGNSGYLGIDDPQHRKSPDRESRRIENHRVLIAKAMLDIGEILGDRAAVENAVATVRSWYQCTGSNCSKLPCRVWSGKGAVCPQSQRYALCFFKRLPALAPLCEEEMRQEGALPLYGLWAYGDGSARAPRAQ